MMLKRYAEYKGAKAAQASEVNLGIYLDAEHIASWALDGVQWAVNAGLITGTGSEILSPKTEASRAQVVTMLLRFEKLVR